MTDSILPYLERLHSVLGSEELNTTLLDILQSRFHASAFSLFYLDEDRGELHLSYTSHDSLELKDDHWGQSSALLQQLFESRHLGPVDSNGHWPEGLELSACAPLFFQEHEYGLLLMHSQEPFVNDEINIQDFGAVGRAVSTELVRLQLYEAASQESLTAASKISAINSTSDLLKNLDLETLLTKLMELSLGIMSAQVGSIMICQEDGITSMVEFGLQDKIIKSVQTVDGGRLVDFVVETGEPLLIHDAANSEFLDLSNLEVNLQSLISIPLQTKTSTLGLINIVNTDAEFQQDDFDVLTTVSNLAASAVENAILQEAALEGERMKEQLQIANGIQTDLLPRSAPEMKGFEVTGWSIPCDETGGDYFDYVLLDDKRLCIIVGDATGHGLGAALMMLIVRSSLRTLLQNSDDLDAIFHTLNNRVEADSDDDKFMTMFCGVVNTEDMKFLYSSAGHEGPLWFSPSRDYMEELPSTGMPLGIMEDIEFDTTEDHDLLPGDILVMGTDGIWEAMDSQSVEFGKERLSEIVKNNFEKSAKEISQLIRDAVLEFISDTHQRDDITLVVGKVEPK